MKIKRAALLTLISSEISRLEDAEKARAERERARSEVALEEYLRETLPHWRTFANRLRRAVSNGEPITYELAPVELRFRHSQALNWWGRRTDAEPREVAEGLRALRLVLELTQDEYVTTTTLERQGFALGRTLKGIR